MLRRASQKIVCYFVQFLRYLPTHFERPVIDFHQLLSTVVFYLSAMRELATQLMTQLLRQLHIHISANTVYITSIRTFNHPCFLSSHHLLAKTSYSHGHSVRNIRAALPYSVRNITVQQHPREQSEGNVRQVLSLIYQMKY